MPELPEVETIRRSLNLSLLDQKIQKVKIFSAKSALPSARFLVKNLVGRSIKKIQRRGKLLIFHLFPAVILASNSRQKFKEVNKKNQPDYLLIHLMMTGQLIYLDKLIKIVGGHSLNSRSKSSHNTFIAAIGGKLPNKYTRIQISFQQGGQLFFNDLRKFGYLKLVSSVELKRLLENNYGPEPLSPAFSLAFFQLQLKNRSTKIKALLLNQKIIAGLGNIYVDESLWRARINPERPANTITLLETQRLYRAIKRIIKQAILYRGTTFNNYVDAYGKKGNFSKFLKVYGRSGQLCRNCHNLLVKKKVAGRGTHYCPYCQK